MHGSVNLNTVSTGWDARRAACASPSKPSLRPECDGLLAGAVRESARHATAGRGAGGGGGSSSSSTPCPPPLLRLLLLVTPPSLTCPQPFVRGLKDEVRMLLRPPLLPVGATEGRPASHLGRVIGSGLGLGLGGQG